MAVNKFKGSFDTLDEPPLVQDRRETRGPGRPIGKRSNPAYRQYTALLRKDTHDRAIEKLRKTAAKPDFGELVEELIQEWLAKP